MVSEYIDFVPSCRLSLYLQLLCCVWYYFLFQMEIDKRVNCGFRWQQAEVELNKLKIENFVTVYNFEK